MVDEPTSFYSDGLKLDASFYWPDTPRADRPLVVICSGYTGMKRIHPERYARFLTRQGYPCFGFDYRGFGASEGTPGEVRLEDQVTDIVHALAYVSAHTKAEGRPIVLIGWGMAGGLILEAARLGPPLRALIPINGFYDAIRVQKAVRGEEGWKDFSAWLQEERVKSAASGQVPKVDCFRIYPLDPVSKGYVDSVLRATPGYNSGADLASLAFADSLLNFAPEKRLDHLGQVPILIAHGDQNALHPTQEAEALHRSYPGPKTLHWIEGAGHTEFMEDDNPIFIKLVARLDEWMKSLD